MALYDVTLIHGTTEDVNFDFIVIADNSKEAVKKVRKFVKSEGFDVIPPRDYCVIDACFTEDGVLHI